MSNSWEKDTDERISELKNYYIGFKKRFVEEIAELRELISDNHKQHGLHIEKHAKQLNEFREWRISHHNVQRKKEVQFNKLKEVLRELIIFHKESIHENNNRKKYWFELLEKLDGSKTVKKDWELNYEDDVKRFNKEIKDLEGEKDGSEEDGLTEMKGNRIPLKSDSKPPEPCHKIEYWKCGYFVSVLDSCTLHNTCCSAHRTEEPRENDSPERIKQIKAMDRQMMVEVGTHIFVKREDLTRYARKLRIWGDGDWKHIKEAYNVE